MSAIVAAVEQSLHEIPFFPPHVRPGEGYDIVIERRADGSLWIHEQHEVGVGRFSPVRTTRAGSVADATRAHISRMGPASIDGVPIDWEN
jgi:hypothetical protein